MILKIGNLSHSADVKATRLKCLVSWVAELRKDVDYIKSIDFNSLIGVANDLDASKTLEMPPATTGDIPKDGTADDESDAESYEEQIAI
ncbi:hypothetical protein H5410_003908 [Solanum commersonii]|uniref:Uncharacterized protein n=1 Tax=Solanum commersonii TaxID=4109 RepID=A0A9J6B6Z4_SOLCO|nr:hypothetical protein H5410_003908 [Solanum commersonii]